MSAAPRTAHSSRLALPRAALSLGSSLDCLTEVKENEMLRDCGGRDKMWGPPYASGWLRVKNQPCGEDLTVAGKLNILSAGPFFLFPEQPPTSSLAMAGWLPPPPFSSFPQPPMPPSWPADPCLTRSRTGSWPNPRRRPSPIPRRRFRRCSPRDAPRRRHLDLAAQAVDAAGLVSTPSPLDSAAALGAAQLAT